MKEGPAVDPTANPEAFPEVDLRNGTVLLVDDDEAVRGRVREFLEEGSLFSRFIEAANGLEAFKILANDTAQIDLIVCDVEMPEFDGFKFLQMRATRDDFAAVPVVILTSRADSEHRVRGLELGASDYLTKPVIKEELRLRARHQLQIRRLQEALRKAIRNLSHMSRTDPLTQLPNRRHFMETLRSEFRRAERYDHALGLLVCDIDDFKRINDTYGHLVGDQVLKGVAEILSYGLRESDLAARYGGEEFAVLLPETDLEGAYLVAERYRHELAARTFSSEEEERFVTTASIGVAAYPEHAVGTETELMRFADGALYRAKELGKNQSIRAETD